jgi:Ca-activated chloride channel family protein
MSRVNRWLTLAALVWALPALGQGLIWPERVWPIEPGPPQPPPPRTWPLATRSEKVDIVVHDFASTVTVDQTFHNQYPNRIEGTFLFALPEGAAVTNFAMTVNGQQVGGELLDAAKARDVYEGIVRRQRDPGLLEYLGRAGFRAKIFPIEPGEDKTIHIEYTSMVPAEEGLARLVFPLKTKAFEHAPAPWPWIPPHPRRFDPMFPPAPPYPRPVPILPLGGVRELDGARPPTAAVMPRTDEFRDDHGDGDQPTEARLVIKVRLEGQTAIKSVYSPTHQVDVHREGDHVVLVGCETKDAAPRDDFILYYQLSDAQFGLSLISYHGGSDERGAYLMLLAPKAELREKEMEAKDIVFVVDISGSMAGRKMEQTKAALAYCLKNLKPTDRFNVLPFSTAVDTFEDKLVEATPAKVKEAVDYVDKLSARGATNISEALADALGELPPRAEQKRPAMVLFMTDGQPTVGETRLDPLLDGVAKANRAEARMFVFGVGDDVNTELLDRLSNDHHGTVNYIKPEEDIEAAISSLYNKIASPVLSDLKLSVEGVKLSDQQPVRLPDLFRGGQLSLVGRYSGDGPATVTLHGVAGGQPQTFTYQVEFPKRARANEFVPRLWATRQVGYLLEQIRLNGENPELVKAVTELASRYGILTPYTSFLVLEPGAASDSTVRAGLERSSHGSAGGPGMPGAAGAPGGWVGGNGGGFGGAGSMPVPMAASKDRVGLDAIDRSQQETRLRDAERAHQSGGVQQAGERTFYLFDGVWTDSTWPKDPGDRTVVRLKSGSEACFALLALRDDLKEALALGEKVKLCCGRTLLVIDPDQGDETLSSAAREALAP